MGWWGDKYETFGYVTILLLNNDKNFVTLQLHLLFAPEGSSRKQINLELCSTEKICEEITVPGRRSSLTFEMYWFYVYNDNVSSYLHYIVWLLVNSMLLVALQEGLYKLYGTMLAYVICHNDLPQTSSATIYIGWLHMGWIIMSPVLKTLILQFEPLFLR